MVFQCEWQLTDEIDKTDMAKKTAKSMKKTFELKKIAKENNSDISDALDRANRKLQMYQSEVTNDFADPEQILNSVIPTKLKPAIKTKSTSIKRRRSVTFADDSSGQSSFNEGNMVLEENINSPQSKKLKIIKPGPKKISSKDRYKKSALDWEVIIVDKKKKKKSKSVQKSTSICSDTSTDSVVRKDKTVQKNKSKKCAADESEVPILIPATKTNKSTVNQKNNESCVPNTKIDDNDENWEDMEDCSDSEVEFDGDDDNDEVIREELKTFMAGLDFEGAKKKTLVCNTNDDEDELEDDSYSDENDKPVINEETQQETKSSIVQQNEKSTVSSKSSALSSIIKASLAKFSKPQQEDTSTKARTGPTESIANRLKNQLSVAEFRMINEKLYTIQGDEAFKMFKEDPESFKVYHEGFRSQVTLWPMNPLNVVTDWLKEKPAEWIVADFGCGDAKLAEEVPQKVHSIDLVATKPHVIACDMAHTPLKTQSCNVVVFCLSLMGSNVNDFLTEANRVLKNGGILKIAEVTSRIQSMDEFINDVQKFGFSKSKKPVNHDYFVILEFKKFRKTKHIDALPSVTLKPCLYKKR